MKPLGPPPPGNHPQPKEVPRQPNNPKKHKPGKQTQPNMGWKVVQPRKAHQRTNKTTNLTLEPSTTNATGD